MKDNLSIVITVIVLVLLMVIFPLYNFFERQDDMSYNLVLKATTNFADQVMNNGYIDQNTYDKFVTELGNTGNVYDIQIEAHRKVLTDATTANTYIEQSYIDYTDDIFESITNTTDSNLMKKSLKNNIYLLNPKDEIYVKVKNSNTTMAGALFNAIIPASKKTRIEVNYGGIIKNNAWKDIDARYTGHHLSPGIPSITLIDNTNAPVQTFNSGSSSEVYNVKKADIENGHFIAVSTEYEGHKISRFIWTLTDLTESSNKIDSKITTPSLKELQDVGSFFKVGNEYSIEVYAINDIGYASDKKMIKIKIINEESSLPETDMLGDLNNTSTLDDEDYVILYNYLNNSGTLTDKQMSKADINGNSAVNLQDLNFLKELIDNGFILGDVNSDNNIGMTDSTLIQKHIAGTISFNDDQKKRADMNKDNKIDEADYKLLQDKVAEKNI